MLRNIPSATLKKLVQLSERRDKIMAQLQDIDREILRVERRFGISQRKDDRPAPVTVSRARPRRKRSRR